MWKRSSAIASPAIRLHGTDALGLILDCSILIAGERRRETVKQVIQRVRAAHGDTESALSAISVIELTTASTGPGRTPTKYAAKPSPTSWPAT
jgi:hypothetical protein